MERSNPKGQDEGYGNTDERLATEVHHLLVSVGNKLSGAVSPCYGLTENGRGTVGPVPRSGEKSAAVINLAMMVLSSRRRDSGTLGMFLLELVRPCSIQ